MLQQLVKVGTSVLLNLLYNDLLFAEYAII